jgi:hypothetical protein
MNESSHVSVKLTPEDVAIPEAHRHKARAIWTSVFMSAVISIGLWFLWRPLGATAGLFTVGYLRRFFSHYGEFWLQRTALLVGVLIGLGVAVLVRVLTANAGVGWFGAFWLGLLGFLSTGYIGYGTSHNAAFDSMNVGRNRATIRALASTAYVLTFVAQLAYVLVIGR